jgi:UDP-sugar transporter A1/2/3
VKLSIWDRNFQLALYSIGLYLGIIAYGSVATGTVVGAGWSALSLMVALLGSLGGILVALSVKHTDSIMKSIAVSGAIVLAGLGGYVFLQGPMTLTMVIGSVCAIIATQNYTFDNEGPKPVDQAETPLLKRGEGPGAV